MRAVTMGLALALAACSGGGRGLGEHCATVSDCDDDLQCLDHTCVPRCRHHVDCGDGMRCNDGACHIVDSQVGDECDSELDCGPGQTCRLAPALSNPPGTCQLQTQAGIPGDTCIVDGDCRSGACALGHCVELCSVDDDCARGRACAGIPRLTADATAFVGHFEACLPTTGSIAFELPLDPDVREPELKIPVPEHALSMVVVTEVDSKTQLIGATRLLSPSGRTLYQLPQTREDFYGNLIRHEPLPGASVLKVPSSPTVALEPGAYTLRLSVFRLEPGPISTNRHVKVIEKLGPGAILDLHFYFGDLTAHPCRDQIGGDLNATTAPQHAGFRDQFIVELRTIFARANVELGGVTFHDVAGHPELDTVTNDNAGRLFALSTQPTGVSVFFVRSISPAGLQILTGGTPGAPLPGTSASGVAISLDALCYRSWPHVARQTAHAVARHLGLFRNKEADGGEDPIPDSAPFTDNLMHYSEFGGTSLSTGQSEILRTSPVLR
ncbi:MAG TPA: hypothetical protein VM734_25635 [Kofleriaceae bacterium]|nr:hypothetical protein [Kofleriaceae bacterium]